MPNDQQLTSLANELFELFEKGEWDQSLNCFSADATITQQFGRSIKTATAKEFINQLKHGPLSSLGNPTYVDRRVQIIGQHGFVEQHITQLSIKGQSLQVPVCIIGQVNSEGQIIKLEEYLDPSAIIKALS